MKLECSYVQLPKIYSFLTGNELKVFTVIFDEWSMMKNEDGWYYRSWKDLRLDTGLSNNGLNNALNGLLSKNLLSKREYPKKEQRSNDYKINLEGVYALANIPTPKKRVTYSQKESTSKNIITKEKNKIYNINNKTSEDINPDVEMLQDKKVNNDLKLNDMKKENEMSDNGTNVMNDNEQGRSNASESDTINEMTTSTSGDKNKTSKEFQNIPVDKSKVINNDCNVQGVIPNAKDCAPAPATEEWKPVAWNEDAIFGSGERQNVSGDKLSTQGKKTQPEPQECPQNETDVFNRISEILEEALTITDVEPFKEKLQEALDMLKQIRPSANRNAFTRCCNDTIYWYTQNNWDDLDMFFVASNFKRDIERMKRA